MLVKTLASRRLVVVACRAAQSQGIRPGLDLTEAHALCPGLVYADHEPDKDMRSLEALGRWMMRFTPVVALEAPDALVLDVTGCQRVFGGLDRLIQLVSDAMDRLSIAARVAIAPTLGGAWAMAFAGGNGTVIVNDDELRQALKPLPTIALRIDPELAIALRGLGIETVAQLLELPRQTLPARFGTDILRRLDQALGVRPEPLVPLQHHQPIRAAMEFDGEVDSLETLGVVLKQLIGHIIDDLAVRGCGARRMQIDFLRTLARPIQKTIHLSRPSRDPAILFNLLRCAMETIETDAGFVGVRLAIPLFEKVADEQLGLLEQDEQLAHADAAHMIERLRVRLGEGAVLSPRLVESNMPERTFRFVEAAQDPLAAKPPVSLAPMMTGKPRPLHLLPEPKEIRCMVVPVFSVDGDATPVFINIGHSAHRLTLARGPERIAGIWWKGRTKTRDYFDVENEAGQRFWIFRVLETRKWYLHGIFDC